MSERITLGPSPQSVVVRVSGVTVAQSGHAVRLNEKGLGAVYYLPRADVDERCLEASSRTSHCPYKGDARYWSLVVGGKRFEDAVWSYETPLPAVAAIAGHMAFWADRIGPALDIAVTP